MEKGTDVAGINDELVDAYHALQEDFAKSQAEITRLNAVIQLMATDLVECGYCADIERAANGCDGRETGKCRKCIIDTITAKVREAKDE